jgi:IrrE N-terminal-like domain
MILLLENQGAIVARDRLGADTLDGLSQSGTEDGRPYMVIGIDKGSPARWRFDAAHELGHMLLHAKVERDVLDRPEGHRANNRRTCSPAPSYFRSAHSGTTCSASALMLSVRSNPNGTSPSPP